MDDILDNQQENTIPHGLRGKLLVDICIQSIILLLTFFFLGKEEYISAFMTFYMGIGIYQLVSSLVHLALQKPDTLFRYYYIQLLVYCFLAFLFFAFEIFLAGYALLFLSPVTALYYFVITIVSFNQAQKTNI